MNKMFRRRAFTLPEVLVTVTIVAVLAAVIVPAVINQVAKGDAPAVAQDLTGIRTAITTFAADTRRFPAKLSDLGGATLSAAAFDILGNAYGADASSGYHGPYAPITSGHISTNGAKFANVLTTSNRAVCMKDSVVTGVSQISYPQISQIKVALDQTDATIAGSSGFATTGQVTYQLDNTASVVTVVPGSVKVCITSY
jgi:prepilin-type N-terminal cleavage/methylation domain-containing protein